MKLITWNLNSIRAREERLIALLERESPDVVCLQELKVEEKDFPFEAVEGAGYSAAVHGQRTYNGVAILSREPGGDVTSDFDDGADEEQARLVAATLNDIRVVCVYVPNGGEVGSDKWTYKLEWLDRLERYLSDVLETFSHTIVCGDFNIAPDERDVARPEQWNDTVLCHPEVRGRLESLVALGLRDVVREHHPEEQGPYTWWDYRMLGFPKGNGLRIDHVLVSDSLADRCVEARVDRDERKGEKPSDHAPVVAVFD